MESGFTPITMTPASVVLEPDPEGSDVAVVPEFPGCYSGLCRRLGHVHRALPRHGRYAPRHALKVDERRETSTRGIYAAGDLANPLMPSVTTAISHGATAGISAQQSMLV
jgi:hypothetical protein